MRENNVKVLSRSIKNASHAAFGCVSGSITVDNVIEI